MDVHDKMRLTEAMARAMLATAPKYKPVYVVRAFKMESDFELVCPDESISYGEAGDYIYVDDRNAVHILDGAILESDFKPIPPRKPRTVTE